MTTTAAPETVIYLDHTARWSGGEIALLRLLTAVDRSRYEPLVVLAEDGPLAAKLREAGIETEVLPLAGRVREVRKDTLRGPALLRQASASAAALAGYAREVARLARRRGAVALHCNSLKSDLYGALAGRLAGIPVVWHVRDHIDPSYLPGPAVRAFRALARFLPTRVIAITDSVHGRLCPGGPPPGRSVVVRDGLSAEELAAAPEPAPFAEWSRRPVRVGLVGRFVEWKGQHVFLEAAERLVTSGRDDGARFVLVGAALFGEDDYAAEIERRAAALGGRAELLGFRPDIAAVLTELDILVHASVTPEPFGQVVIEGMAAGLPVIATDGGGVREIVRHGEDGLLVPMGDAAALADALAGLLADPARASRLAVAGHRAVRERFTAARAAREVEAVYDGLPRRRRRPRSAMAAGGPAAPAPR
jgi:glycosyltransferase involved in cell wall biosynthesis